MDDFKHTVDHGMLMYEREEKELNIKLFRKFYATYRACFEFSAVRAGRRSWSDVAASAGVPPRCLYPIC